jgi:D-glycero-D-manno-heptose 1,7-bisphosphate phosphatase
VKKALFLDRDGVVNIEKEYLYKIEEFEFIDGIVELCRCFQDLGYLIFIVTNQSGIAREFYTQEDLKKLTQWMLEAFKKSGVTITKVYHCPHHPDISGACTCRKPEPGMLREAAEEFDVDLQNSIMIGDKERDSEAGINAGLRETYLFDESGSVSSSKATKIVKKLDEIWKERC